MGKCVLYFDARGWFWDPFVGRKELLSKFTFWGAKKRQEQPLHLLGQVPLQILLCAWFCLVLPDGLPLGALPYRRFVRWCSGIASSLSPWGPRDRWVSEAVSSCVWPAMWRKSKQIPPARKAASVFLPGELLGWRNQLESATGILGGNVSFVCAWPGLKGPHPLTALVGHLCCVGLD